MKLNLHAFGLLLLLFSSSALADLALPIFEKGEREFRTSQSTEDNAQRQKMLYQSATHFRQLVDAYPNHTKVPEALYYLGAVYQDLANITQDRDAATRSTYFYRELAQKYPNHSYSDNALFALSQICQTVFQDTKCASEALDKIRTDYPNGDIRLRLDGPAFAGDARLTGIEISENEKELVISFALTARKDVVGKTVVADPSMNLPERYFFDLQRVRLQEGFTPNKIFTADSPISQIRYGKNQESLRVVLDLAKNAHSNQIRLVNHEKGFAVHVSKEFPSPSNVPVAVAPPQPSVAPTTTIDADPVISEIQRKGKHRIILDAGHGGEDTGAIGKRGTLEKNICLKIVKKIADLLAKRSEYEVFLTRNNDYFVPLAKRTALANDWKGDLFVSIHANASPKRGAEGISTYFLDNHDDLDALEVQERENAEPGVVIAANLNKNENQYLEIMKASMVKNFHTVQSTDFAQFVQKSLLKELRREYSGISDLGVKSARFFVLTGSRMPSILVESSFISNPQEERRLSDRRYQLLIAQAVVKGIDQFFKSSVGRGDHTALFRK